jgi:phosphoribosylformylglycinamidine (FGAM) synthase-like enzyme
VQIGEVIEGDILRYYMHGELVAEVPADSLVLGGGAPVYDREYREPSYYKEKDNSRMDQVPVPDDLPAVARKLLAHPNIASKELGHRAIRYHGGNQEHEYQCVVGCCSGEPEGYPQGAGADGGL